MTGELDPRTLLEESDALFVAAPDARPVVRALEALAEEDGMDCVAPSSLWPHGRGWRGQDGPSARRFLVSPPEDGIVTLLCSVPDWDHQLAPRLAERLRSRAACLMLYDGDIFTCHLHEGRRTLLAWLSSPLHFDREPVPLEGAERALSAFAGREVGAAEAAAALAPPGLVDVDGRLAFARTLALLGLPVPPFPAYRAALADDALTSRPELAHWTHVAHHERDVEPEPDERSAARRPALAEELPPGVLPFRRKF